MNIAGMQLTDLCVQSDERGFFSEIFRASWLPTPFVQWNLVRSRATVLRGVHCHFRHSDYFVLLEGAALIGLTDIRPDSPTAGQTELLSLRSDRLQGLSIPPGVAHGFYFTEPSAHVYAVSHYWNRDDELGCRWDDPALGIPWPMSEVILSQRDADLPPFDRFQSEMLERLAAPTR